MIIKSSCFKKFPELIFDKLYERYEYKHKISFTSTYSKEEYPISDNYLNIIHTGIIRWGIVFYKKHVHCAQNTIMPKIQRHHLYSAKSSIQLPRIKSSCNYNHTIIKESIADTLYNHQLEANKLETWQTLRGASTWYIIMHSITISHISIGNTIAVSYCTRSYISCS